MKIHDISVPISSSLATYKGDPGVRVSRRADLESGDEYTISQLEFGAHTGTHVDAPLHFIRGGAAVDKLKLEALIGPALVVDLSQVEHLVTARDLQSAHVPHPVERLLLKTRNADLWERPDFQEDFIGIGPDAAQWLLNHGVKLVGIDYLSIELFGSEDHLVHRLLLKGGVVILEGLDLRGVTTGEYELVCLPLKLAGAEGAPARAVLIER